MSAVEAKDAELSNTVPKMIAKQPYLSLIKASLKEEKYSSNWYVK